MKNTRIIPMRRLPGPASCPLGDGVKAPEAPVELFRGWQRTQTQSSVRTLRGLRQQMDVWFCLMQESSAERLCCVTVDPDQTNCAPSGARPGILCFSLDLDLHRCCVTVDPDQTNCAPSGARPGILCFSLDLDLHRRGQSGMYGPPPFCKRIVRKAELVCANVFGLYWSSELLA